MVEAYETYLNSDWLVWSSLAISNVWLFFVIKRTVDVYVETGDWNEEWEDRWLKPCAGIGGAIQWFFGWFALILLQGLVLLFLFWQTWAFMAAAGSFFGSIYWYGKKLRKRKLCFDKIKGETEHDA